LEVDTANHYHGNDALPFTFYLTDSVNGNIGVTNDDIRKLVVPINWNQPASHHPLWDSYNKTGNNITGASGIPVIPEPMNWLDF